MNIDKAIKTIKESIEIIEKEAYWFKASELEKVIKMLQKQPQIVRCKDCKCFSFKEYWEDIGHGAKILVTDHCPTCDKWADGGCKTDPEGFCFLAERVDA